MSEITLKEIKEAAEAMREAEQTQTENWRDFKELCIAELESRYADALSLSF